MEWYPSRRGSVSGKSLRRCAPRLSWRASAEAATRRASGCGSSSRRVRPSASRSSPAPRHTASRVSRAGGVTSAGAAAPARCGGGGSSSAGRGGAAAEHEALLQRVRGEPVGAVEAGAGALADRVAGPGPRCGRGGRWRCRPSRSARRGRRGRARVIGSSPASRSASTTLGKRPGSTWRMSRWTWGCAGGVHDAADGAGDLVARRELVDEALAVRRRGAWRPRRARPRRRGSPRGPARP